MFDKRVYSLTSRGVFNSTLLEDNKIQQSFNLGHHATLYVMGLKLFTRSLKNGKAPRYKRCSFVINFLQKIFIRLLNLQSSAQAIWANRLGKPFEI